MEVIAVITVFVLALTMALLMVKAEPWWFCIPFGLTLVVGPILKGGGVDAGYFYPVPLFASMFLAVAVLTKRLRPRAAWYWAILGVYYGMGLGLWLVVERPLLDLADPTGRILYLQAGLLPVVVLPLLGGWVTQRLWGSSEQTERPK